MQSMDSGFNEIKDVKSRRGIREGSEEVFGGIQNRLKLNNNEDRSNSEPPRSFGTYLPSVAARLKPIREKNREDAQGSSDEDELSKSNSQLNESDFELELPDSVSQTPTPTPLTSSNARRINSETNLNDTKRRMSGFMGNRSKRFCASTSELSFSSHLDTQKSLFSPKNNALSRQSFNSSLYGSNMSLSSTNSRLFMTNSPFYSGKTMFGGASAYPKRDINQHKILRTPVQMRPSSSLSNCSNSSTKSDNIVPESNAAKRILEIMNQFTGPLKEARAMGNNINSIIKIPSLVQDKKRYGENELNLDRSIALTTPTTPYGRSIASKKRSESPSITKPLQIPTMSQLLQMKRLQSNTERVREIASRSDSFLNQNHEYKLPSSDDNHSNSTATSLKMKSNITKNLLRNDKQSTNEPATPVNLPNIQLPAMRGIPKFDIQLPLPVVKAIEKPKPVATPTVQFNFQAKKSEFVLSKPLPLEIDDADGLSIFNKVFKFTKPYPIDADEEVPTPSEFFEVSIEPQSNLASVLVKSAPDNLFASLVAKQKSSSWECDSCLTRNDSEKIKCLCCDNSKPGSEIAPKVISIPSSIAPAADNLFKSLAAQQKKKQWDCSECMTKNDVEKVKCACCEAPKPGSQPVAVKNSFEVPATAKSDDLFKSLAAKQKTESWECDDCMTRNDIEKTSCIACEKPKPGSKPSTGMKLATTSSFSFGMLAATKTDEGFKKIAEKQAAGWECSACMTNNEASKTKCVCCEQSKPGTNEAAPYFSFSSSSLKPASSLPLPVPSEVKFSFGMPAEKKEEVKDEVDKPKSTFSFGMPAAKVPEVQVEKPKEPEPAPALVPAPAFSFKAPSPSAANPSFILKATEEKKEEKSTEKPPMFSFGATPKDSPVKTITFGGDLKTSPLESKKEETNPVFGGFKFGAEPAKPIVKPLEPQRTPEVKSTPVFGSSLNNNGGFSFGGFGSKPAEPEPIKPQAPGGFAFGGSSMSFGATSNPAPAPATTTASTFMFGASKTENEPPKTFGSFGMNSSPVKSTFPAPTSNSSFPQTNSTNAFSFTAKKEEAAPQIFAFGAKPMEPTNSAPMLFGSQSTAVPQVTPVFGASFGASTNNNNNNEFGSKMPSFGNQPQKRSFDFTSSSADVSQSKKFDFGGQQQVNSAPFQFNSNTENKPAFNFNASATAPSYNFSNPNANNLQDQQNLYQFGANNSNSTQGTFAFAPTSAPVMQFGPGAMAPQLANSGLTTFSAPGTGSAAAANQRKILRARRTTRR